MSPNPQLSSVLPLAPFGDEVQTHDGVRASVGRNGSRLVVTNARGDILLEHENGKTTVKVPQGDVVIDAEMGDLRLRAKRAIQLEARQVGIAATREVTLTSGSQSRLAVSERAVDIRSETVVAAARRARIGVRDIVLGAESLTTAIERVRSAIGVAEIKATRIVERAKNVYREVEETSQLRAGRLRWIAKGTVHLFGERTLFKSREDVAIKGKQIHLG